MSESTSQAESNSRKGGIYALAVGLVFTALFLLSGFAPQSWRLWGIDSLAFTALPYRFVWILGAGLFATGLALLTERQTVSGRRATIILFVWMAAVALLSFLLPDETHLRGDGILLLQDFKLDSLRRLRAPLTALVIELIRNGLDLKDPTPFYRYFDLFWFVVYLAAVLLLVRRYSGTLATWIGAVVLTLNGVLLLMSGLMEYYAPVFAVAALALAITLHDLDRDKYPVVGLLLTLLASAFHYLAVVLLPAFLIPLMPRIGKLRTLLLFLLLAVLGVVAGMLLFPENLLWPLGPREMDALSLYDPRHLLDALNLLFWALPAGLAALPLAVAAKGYQPFLDDTVGTFLAAASLGAIGFLLAFSPDLGMARDADLVSLIALPGSLWILHRLNRKPEWMTPALLALTIFAGILGSVGQLALHANPDHSVERFKRMLVRDPERSAYGWEALGIYYRMKGDRAREYDSIQLAARYSNNWRYYVRLADIAKDRKQFDVAEQYVRKALSKHPNDPTALYTLGHIQLLTGRRSEGKATLNRCLSMNSNIVSVYSLMGYLLYEDGEYSRAEEVMLRGARSAGELDALYYATFTLIETRLGKHSAARRLFQQINPTELPREMYRMAREAYEISSSALRAK